VNFEEYLTIFIADVFVLRQMVEYSVITMETHLFTLAEGGGDIDGLITQGKIWRPGFKSHPGKW